MLPDVGIWCNTLVCRNHTQQILHHMTSPLVSVLFVPSLHSYHFCRKFLIFSSIYICLPQNVCTFIWVLYIYLKQYSQFPLSKGCISMNFPLLHTAHLIYIYSCVHAFVQSYLEFSASMDLYVAYSTHRHTLASILAMYCIKSHILVCTSQCLSCDFQYCCLFTFP